MGEWVKYICTMTPCVPSFDIESSFDFATAVITTVGKVWDSLSDEDRNSILPLLSRKKCMPTTKAGLRYPKDTYLPTVKVLPDLPLIVTMKGVKGQFLDKLGVRRVVELKFLFERLGHGGAWSHIEVIKYLSSVRKFVEVPEES